MCVRIGDSCREDADCQGLGTCERELLIAGASDSDDDEIADPFDNCPDVANVAQADGNLDGIGDACEGAPPSVTVSPEATSTRTPDVSVTPAASPTDTPMVSPTSTPIASPTETPMASPSGTSRSTRTDTPVATSTATRPTRPTSTPTAAPCVGDCEGDGIVTVDEIVLGVNVALGMEPLGVCPVFDCNRNGELTVDCLIRAVTASLHGCS